MELLIPLRRMAYIAVALLITYELSQCSCIIPLGSSNDSGLSNKGMNLKFNGCDSTSCSTIIPIVSSQLVEAASSFRNSYFFNKSLSSETKGGLPLDVRSSEFVLLHNIISGIINKFAQGTTGTKSTSVTELVDFITLHNNGTEKSTTGENGNKSNSSIPVPALFNNLKILVPPFLSELLGRLTEIFDRDLPEDYPEENKSNSDSIGFLESFRQTMLGMAPDKTKYNDAENEVTPGLKNELDEILNNVKQQVQNPVAKRDKVDELCERFEEHVNSRIQPFNDTSMIKESDVNHKQNNRIVETLKKTTDVVCSDSNKKLLKKLANSQKIWANKITKKVLSKAIDRISKGKSILRFILNLIMGIVVDTPNDL